MRYLTAILLYTVLVSSAVADCGFLNDLSPYQQQVARKGFLHGSESDLGLTVVAIMWQESRLGLYKINVTDGKYGSYGVGHALMDYRGAKLSAFSKNAMAQRLVDDDDYAIQTIIADLKTWEKHSHSWSETVGRYNGGWRGSKSYVAKIKATIHKIRGCNFA